MSRTFTSLEVEQLRRDAKREGRELSISHAEALNRIASRHGFQNWSLLMRHVDHGSAKPTPVTVRVNPAELHAALSLPRMEATREEYLLIAAIAARYQDLAGADFPNIFADRMTLMMDIEACHCNGCPLDLVALLEAPRDIDVIQDVAGIVQHLDRNTGRLLEFFTPRYALRVA